MRQLLNLSPKQRKILSLLELAPERTLASISRETGYRPATIAYTVETLRDRKVIRQTAVIDFFKLGLIAHATLFSLHGSGEKARAAFVQYLEKKSAVAWFGSLLGAYEYGFSLLVKNAGEAKELLDEAISINKVAISDKIMTTRLGIRYYGRRYLSSSTKKRKPLAMKWTAGPYYQTDQVDKQILRSLANEDVRSIRDVARKTGTSFASADRRVKRLKADGVITALVFVPDSDFLGLSSFRLLISTRRMEASVQNAMIAIADDIVEVVLLLESFGTWDFELDIEVLNMQEATRIVRTITERGLDWIEDIQLLGENQDFRFSFFPF